MFAFSTIQNFKLPCFLQESARVIKNHSYLFIYTGVRDQLWKENNPFTMDMLKQALETVDTFSIESVVLFAYNRMAVMEQMFTRPANHYYSTFSPLSPEGLEEALKMFSIKIRDEFKDMHSIHWFDDHVMFIIKKEAKSTNDYLKPPPVFSGPGMVV
jgi:hypothetical protein